MRKGQRLLGESQTHLYLIPHPTLRPYVAHYTVMFPAKLPACQQALTLIPDASGCIVLRVKEGEAAFWGPTTKAVTVAKREGETLVFVEFLPGGAYPFFDAAPWELADCRVPFAFIDKKGAGELSIAGQSFGNYRELAEKLDALLLRRLCRAPGLGSAFAKAIRQSSGKTSVGSLSEDFIYSQRHINRLFRQEFGIGIKTYARIFRINLALSRIKSGGGTLTQLSQELGYYDQSHFIRDFKIVCGAPPTGYLSAMSGYYNELYKF